IVLGRWAGLSGFAVRGCLSDSLTGARVWRPCSTSAWGSDLCGASGRGDAGEGWYGGGEQVGFRTVVFGCAVARGFRQSTQAVDVDRLAVAEQSKDDRQADSHLGGGDDDDEQRQHL